MNTIIQHFTVSGLVLIQNHVLLVNHPRLGAWVQPGGHLEFNELPHQAVIREILEETGLKVDILSDAMPVTGDPDYCFLPSPLCMQKVKAHEKGQEVFHVDIVYLCLPSFINNLNQMLPELSVGTGIKEAAWVSIYELKNRPLAKNVWQAVELAWAKLQSQKDYQYQNTSGVSKQEIGHT